MDHTLFLGAQLYYTILGLKSILFLKFFKKFFKVAKTQQLMYNSRGDFMSEPIRILNLFTIMNRGGAETMVMNYYRNIDKSKIQFDFLVHRQERGAYDDEIEAMGGRIYRMCPIHPQNFGKYKKMLKVFFDEHPEYKILHSHMSELGCFAFIEAHKRGIRVKVCHAHNAPVRNSMTLKEKGQLLFRDYFKKKMLPYSDFLFICGEEAGNWLYGHKNKDRFIMMNNAVDASKFRYNPEHNKEIRQELGFENEFLILNVGRFNPQKNHTFIVDIFEQIKKTHPSSKLLLAGNGELENEIRNKVLSKGLGDDVVFLGLRSDIHKLLSASDVFLFPSLYEGLPVTMVEAQASGIRCFISDAIPSQCILGNDVSVMSLNDSPEKWAEEITCFADGYTRPDRYESIADAGFDIKANAKWLEEFYITEYNKNYKE